MVTNLDRGSILISWLQALSEHWVWHDDDASVGQVEVVLQKIQQCLASAAALHLNVLFEAL